MLDFCLTALATWRLARLLVTEAGPGNVLGRLRERTGIEYTLDPLTLEPFVAVIHNEYTPLYCVLCTSVWVGALIGLLPWSVRRALAYSAVACLLEKVP